MEGKPGMYSFQLAKSFYSKEKKQWIPYFKWWAQDLAVLLILVPQAIMWLDEKSKALKYAAPIENKIIAEAHAQKEPDFNDIDESDLPTPSPDEEDDSPNI
jgi:hypothetical protein